MIENSQPNKLEQMAIDVYDYVDMQIDKAKLDAADHLSVISSTVISTLIAALFIGIAIVFFAVMATYALAMAIGSPFWAIVIMGGLFLLLGIIFWSARRKLFANQMTRVFCKLLFNDDQQPKL